jgi:hypothetical protein
MGSASYDVKMRTTLTLDPDIAQELKARTADGKVSFKEVVNDTLRRGLAAKPKAKAEEEFHVTPRSLGLRPGIDPDKLSQFLDELDVQDFVRKMRRSQKRR